MKRLLLGLTLCSTVLHGPLGAPGASAETPGQEVADHPWIGATAPGFALEGVDGRTLALEDLRGRFVVIHFGTSW